MRALSVSPLFFHKPLSRKTALVRVRAQSPQHEDDAGERVEADRANLERSYASEDGIKAKPPGLFASLQKRVVDKGYVKMRTKAVTSVRERMQRIVERVDTGADPFHEIAENAKDFATRVTALLQLGLTSAPALALPGAVILVTILTYAVFGSEFLRIGAN